MLNIQFADAKIFYDQDGKAQEVLISYEIFQRLLKLLEQLRTDSAQGYFWSDEWQARVREGETDVYAGRTMQVTADNLETALDWLDE